MDSFLIDISNPTGSWSGLIGMICFALVGVLILWWYIRNLKKDPTNEKDD